MKQNAKKKFSEDIWLAICASPHDYIEGVKNVNYL